MPLGVKTVMQQKGITIEAVASLLKIHRNSASNKVNGETEFSVGEALDLQSMLFMTRDREASENLRTSTGG